MGRALVSAAAVTVLLGSAAAWAEPSQREESFMTGTPTRTVYATPDHMGFSMRSTVIGWLGGVTIVERHEVRSAERDGWWGREVPLVPADERGGAGH